MNDEKMVTEREAVEREREAVKLAIATVFSRSGARLGENWEGSILLAARLFPLPKVTRPRVLRCGSFEFKVVGDVMMERNLMGAVEVWETAQGWAPKPEQVAAWADLFANPAEECEG